jgi:hypothetical protein
MKITVVRIIDEVQNKIEFSSAYGEAIAIWHGVLPSYEREYYVEMAIKGVYTFNHNILPSIIPIFELKMSNDFLVINCQIEEVEEKVTTLRLGDSLILLETNGEAFDAGTSVKFEVKATNVILYDIDSN